MTSRLVQSAAASVAALVVGAVLVFLVGSPSSGAPGVSAPPVPTGSAAAVAPWEVAARERVAAHPQLPARRPLGRVARGGPVRSGGGSVGAAGERVRAVFPGFVEAPAWTDPRRDRSIEIERYVSPQTAIVRAHGQPALVSSTMPMVADTPRGQRPVDTTLRAVSGRLVPRQPLAAYSIGERAGAQLVELDGSGVSLGVAAGGEPAR